MAVSLLVYFSNVTISTQQLLFQSSYFFKAAAFGEKLLSRSVAYLQQLFFQNSYFFRAKLLLSSYHLRIGSSLGQLLFGTATFLAEDLFRIKISTEELLFRSRYFCIASTFPEEQHFGKSYLFRKSISALPTFSGELPF